MCVTECIFGRFFDIYERILQALFRSICEEIEAITLTVHINNQDLILARKLERHVDYRGGLPDTALVVVKCN